MIVSIHQPQYLPWLPYLLKIAASDIFIILDSVDYDKKGLQNRNQIKTPQGKAWLTVPVKKNPGPIKIKDVEINCHMDWPKKHWRALEQNYKKASFFHTYAGELEKLYSNNWQYLVDLNIYLLHLLIKWFGLGSKIMRSSSMAATGHKTELLLNLCCEVGASAYLSGLGAKKFLDEQLFAEAGIGIIYNPPVLPMEYPQQYHQIGFINDVSAIDLILNCGDSWQRYVGD